MASSETINETAQDAKAQIAQLRRQVETLMNERVSPAITEAAARAETAARQATDFTRDQAELLSGKVREQPLIAIMLAGATGYLLGRLFR